MIDRIKNESELFQHLEQGLQGSNYSVGIQSWSFYSDSDSLSLSDLDQINNGPFNGIVRPLVGRLELDNFNAAKIVINEYLSYVSHGAYPIPSLDTKLVNDRQSEFLLILESLIPPLSKTYQYFPESRTRFDMGFIWDCVYIFIANKKGLLIAMGASD